MFKTGDLVMITYPLFGLNGDLGVIIRGENFGLGFRWLVHSTVGRPLWFRQDELAKAV